jgi:uncharacterized Ntn-hydrolase superfamily protein
MTIPTSTFSIVARDATGQLGVAVSSRVPAVGGRCPFVRPRSVAISTQAYLNPYLAFDMFCHLDSGAELDQAAAMALGADPGREWRQLIAIRRHGEAFAHTGRETDPWAGHRIGRDCASAGNLLVGGETVGSMVDAFERSAGALPERLLGALEAGQSAGGDRRGKQSAALLVYADEEMPFVNLRVDDHADPITELRRIWGLYSEDDLAGTLRMAMTRKPSRPKEIAAVQADVRRELAEEDH